MDNQRKQQLKQEYKEAPKRKGIFAIRSSASGRVWVGSSNTLDTIRNRIWFTLGMGTHPNRALQGAWSEEGADAMTFEIVEAFPDDVADYALDDLMKERTAHWATEMGAERYQ